MTNVVYTAYFVDSPEELLFRIPVTLTGDSIHVYAHHVTVEYMPKNGFEDIEIGKKCTFLVYGKAKNESVEAVLVKAIDDSVISTNKHPHITIATAHGVQPQESNTLIEDSLANQTVEYYQSPIEITVTLGYFNGSEVVVE